jgi:PTS system nitrogen regulatory IIA component
MRVSGVLDKEHIIAELEAQEKREVLDEMAALLSITVEGLKQENLVELLLEREKLGSTGIGHGVAIPHAKVEGIDSIVVALARSRRGVDFDSMDAEPVHIFFLIIAPESAMTNHLKILSGISSLLKDEEFRERLMSAKDGDAMLKVVIDEESRQKKGMIA